MCIYEEIYYKELAHVIMNAGEPKIRIGQQAERIFQTESKGILLYQQELTMFQMSSEGSVLENSLLFRGSWSWSIKAFT